MSFQSETHSAKTFGGRELEEHAVWLRRLARGLARDAASADDLAQEAWYALARREGEGIGNLRAWLAGTARRISQHAGIAAKRRSRREEAVARQEAVAEPGPLDERLELQRLLADELATLREPFREVLVMRYFDGLSTTEIARRRGVPAGTVRSQVTRGLAELREKLDRRSGGRAQWCAVLLRIAGEGEGLAVSSWKPLTLVAMSSALKPILAITALAAVGFWFLFDSDEGLEPVLLEEIGAVVQLEDDLLVEERVDESPERFLVVQSAKAAPRESAGLVVDELITHPFAGRLVDSRTLEPLPDYRFSFELGEESERLVTDASGAFASKKEYPAGPATLHFFDRSSRLSRDSTKFETQHPLEQTDVAILAGPTYRFDIDLPASLGIEDLEARLITTRVHQLVETGSRTPLRVGALPWVRFDAGVAALPGPAPWKLFVEDENGLWRGSAEVDRVIGASSPTVRIEMEALGALRVRVLNADGPVRTSRYLVAKSLDRRDKYGHPEERRGSLYVGGAPGLTPDQGTFLLRGMPEGRYELSLDDDRHEAFKEVVTVTRGETNEHDILLKPRVDLETIRGRITSRAGEINLGMILMEAKGIGEAGGSFMVQPTLDETGEYVFEFENVPPGTYRVKPIDAGRHTFEPESLEAVTGARDLAFECRDDKPPLRLSIIRFIDAETNEPVPKVHALVRWRDDTTGKRDGFYTRADIGGNLKIVRREGATLSWMARADGYSAVVGGIEELERGVDHPISLARTWGEELTVRHGGTAVAGVAILLDGQPAGMTNEDGRLLLLAPKAPTHIQIDSEAWTVLPNGIVKPDGSWNTSVMGLTMSVQPKP